MLTVKIWALDRDFILDEGDIEYCKNHNILLEVEQSKPQMISHGTDMYYFHAHIQNAKLTTTDELSETMLQLRYAGEVTLLSKHYRSDE